MRGKYVFDIFDSSTSVIMIFSTQLWPDVRQISLRLGHKLVDHEIIAVFFFFFFFF